MATVADIIEACDGEVSELSFVAEDLAASYLGHVEFEDCTFEECSFAEVHADRISFERCSFVGCDLSNARLHVSFWRDCELRESRLVGCDLHHSYLVRNSWVDCAASFVNLAESKIEQLTLRSCDLREASLAQLRLKRVTLEACDFTRAEFFGTRLRGVDLSSCTLAGIRVSDTLTELRGAKVGIDQAPDLMGLLGVKLV